MEWSYADIIDVYNRVRSLLNISELEVSDLAIDMPEKGRFAELYIKKLVPLWEQYKNAYDIYTAAEQLDWLDYKNDADKFIIFESCIVYQIAILLEPQVTQTLVKRLKSPSLEKEYQNITNENALSLSDMLKTLLDNFIDLDAVDFYGFDVS